jgi:hypothetical protein
MKFKKITISKSTRKNKRLMSVFLSEDGTTKTTHFGSVGGYTYLDGATEETKKNYLLRHKKNEDWNDITTAGALSRWVLWSVRTKTDVIKQLLKYADSVVFN